MTPKAAISQKFLIPTPPKRVFPNNSFWLFFPWTKSMFGKNRFMNAKTLERQDECFHHHFWVSPSHHPCSFGSKPARATLACAPRDAMSPSGPSQGSVSDLYEEELRSGATAAAAIIIDLTQAREPEQRRTEA